MPENGEVGSEFASGTVKMVSFIVTKFREV